MSLNDTFTLQALKATEEEACGWKMAIGGTRLEGGFTNGMTSIHAVDDEAVAEVPAGHAKAIELSVAAVKPSGSAGSKMHVDGLARRCRQFTRLVVLSIFSFAAHAAQAQSYPTRPVRIIVPYSAGGLVDTVARGIASDLSKAWGQPVVVENRPGAGTTIGTDAAAKSAPDGYTILMADNAGLSSSQFLFSKLPYNPARDFTPVINIVASITVLVGAPSLQANTLREFMAAAQAKPGQLTYGTFGVGSATHMTTEEFSALAGIKLNHIPYKGIAEVVPAVMGGQIDVALSAVSPVLNLIRAGKLKALAYAGSNRSQVLPDVPTFAELGLPFETWTWFGFVVPAGTSRAIVDKIAADTGRIIMTSEFDKKFATGVGLELINQGPDQFADFLKKDRAIWADRVRRVNVKLD